MIKYLLRSVMRRALFGGALTAVLLAANKNVSWSDAAVGAILTATASFGSIAAGITMARGDSMRYQVSELVIRMPIQITGVAIAIFMDKATGFTLVLCSVIASVSSAGYLLALLPTSKSCRPVPPPMGRLIGKFMTSASINATLFSLFSSCDILLGSRILSSSEIAPLGIANRVSSSLAMINGAIFDLQSSKFALAIRRQQNQEIQRITRLVAAESALLTILTGIVLLSACVALYSHLPDTYLAAIWPLAILMVGRLIQGSLGPGPAVMTLRGRHAQLGWIVGSAIATEGALIYLLAPVMGTIGLATASAVGLILYSVAVNVCIKRMSRVYIRAQS
jgi:O-antigen/teichoic acid export membrane protein